MNQALKTESHRLFRKFLFARQIVWPAPSVPRLLLLLVTLISITPLVAAQTVKFKTPTTYPAGSPSWIAAGDLNGDGNTDVIATDQTHNAIVVLLGKGDGTLQPATTYHLTAAPYRFISGDFNRDGNLDVIVSFPNPPNGTFSVLFGKGDGTFQTPVNYTFNTSQLRAADFNGDGYPDLAILGAGIQILLNNGDGTFRTIGSYSFQSPRVLATADLNGDGKIDLIEVSTIQSGTKIVNTVSVLLGKGDGTFQPQIDSDASTVEASTGPYSIVVADFDRDGKLDLALSDETLKILKGNGDGTFKPPSVHFRLGNTSTELKPGDFNGDGKIDLVTTGVFGTGALQLLLGNGDGTFLDAGNQIGGANGSSTSVAVADLNGDTRPDLLSNFGGGLTVALVNATPGNVDNTDYFVHQQYQDFLDREPDANGFGFWTNEIVSCGADAVCQQTKRINVSAAFYLSIEFQQTAYLVERL
ncbi:MAG TPA: FG-GAP-like repeat-containing protein, partial [Pyrinomonadaceae bacterium]|nr:FG-GAP-like repeat-containing protein [Pyrinomonadaceae bacterium]